ncbi:MAG TPA: hypothetical protein VL172_01720 [Kofleriaceae bacterium]|nr:hypothetical protein [Kofleriaceae bacterium]
MTGEVTWLRLGGSLLHRRGNLFLRADGGLDVPLADGDFDADPLVRANVGGGIQIGTLSLAGELVTTGTTNGDVDEQFRHTLAGTVALDTGSLRPYGAIIVPLDESIRDYNPLIIMGGLEVPIATR